MKIIDAQVDWYHTYANNPNIKILLNEKPNYDDFVYEEHNNIYYAENFPLVSFFYYKNPDQGYGGRHFNLKMKDGTVKTLKGPWSSNSASVMKEFNTQIMEVTYCYNRKTFERGYTFYAGAMLVQFIIEEALPIIKKNQNPHVKLIMNRGFYTFGVPHTTYPELNLEPGYYKPMATEEELEKINRGRSNNLYIWTPKFICGYDENVPKNICSELSSEQSSILDFLK